MPEFQFGLIQACAALPALDVLRLGHGWLNADEWRDDVVEVLPQLRVKELWASAVYGGDVQEVSQLQHLRRLPRPLPRPHHPSPGDARSGAFRE